MLFDGVRMKSINPEDRVVEAVADAVGPDVIGDLPYSVQTKRTQSRVIEFGGTADIRNADSSVVNHHDPSYAYGTVMA